MRIKITLLLAVIFASVGQVIAQPANPSGDPDVPITGIEILIALGGALGIKKLVSGKKKTL